MEDVLHYFPLVLYVLGSVLLVILIIIGIKFIKVMNKANQILEDTYNKTRSLNGLFHVIDKITDGLSNLSDSLVISITNAITKVFKRKNKDEEE